MGRQRLRCIINTRRGRRLVPPVLSALLGACVPSREAYFLPVAPGATIRTESCLKGPPFEAAFVDPSYHIYVSLHKDAVLLTLYLKGVQSIAIDTSQFFLSSANRKLTFDQVRVWKTREISIGMQIDNSRVIAESQFLSLKLIPSNPLSDSAVLQIPPILLDKVSVQLPDITFTKVRQWHAVALTGNC